MPVKDYIVTCGLEVHAQVNTNSKMFCACPAKYGEPPNTLTCPVCLGLPGSLPVLNKGAIEKTILMGLMLGCEIPAVSKWDRKNYFYPDMPKNYQISQFDLPLCVGGGVPLYDLAYPKDAQKKILNPGKVVGLTRIHLEEDVAKSTHHENSTTIDFNRAGTPLMEIVSEPEISTPEEAAAYLTSLRQILIYGGIGFADMEKGQMRCDVNVSVRKNESDPFGAKIELKNLNSISGVRRGLAYEIVRQCEELDQGIEQVQSTRRWDDDLGETQLMRVKEDSADYRYFPDPDLLPVRTTTMVEEMKTHVPELPDQKRDRFVSVYGVSEYDAGVLASERPLADYYESAAKGSKAPKKVANWVINNLLSVLNESNIEIGDCKVAPEKLRSLVALIEAGTISNNQGKEVFTALFDDPTAEPEDIAKAKGFEPADSGEIEGIVEEVIAAHPDKVEEVRGGNDKMINWLTGQVMKASKGKANPKTVGELLRAKIG